MRTTRRTATKVATWRRIGLVLACVAGSLTLVTLAPPAGASPPAFNLDGSWGFTLHNCKGKTATTTFVISQFQTVNGAFRFADASAQQTGMTGTESGDQVRLGSFGTGTVALTGTSLTLTIPLHCAAGVKGTEVLVNRDPDLAGASSTQAPGTLPASARNLVIADVEKTPGCGEPNIPVGSVDPSFKPTKGLTIATAVLPTGQAYKVPTGHGNAIAFVLPYHPANVPTGFNGSGTALSPSQVAQVPSGVTVISAHGLFYTGNGLVRVPPGTTVTTFVPLGTSMEEDLGLHIDSGNLSGDDDQYERTYQPGDLVPNFTFVPFNGQIGGAGTTVADPTTLEDVLSTSTGHVDIAACAPVYTPAGETVDQALSELPVYTPGSSEVDHLPPNEKVTITSNGQLDIENEPATP